jgi:hypothetical protein
MSAMLVRSGAPGRYSRKETSMAARAFYVRHGFVEGPPGVNRVNGQPNVEYRWRPGRLADDSVG